MEEKKWIYIRENDNSVRYVLGYIKEKPLFCMGINPSTATPEKLDNTLRKVEQIALNNGYDSFVMFNVYPVRSTDFKLLSKEANQQFQKRNAEEIAKCIAAVPGEINLYLAFGNMIDDRAYMKGCLQEIFARLPRDRVTYWCTKITQKGNPKHPLYERNKAELIPFELEAYLKGI